MGEKRKVLAFVGYTVFEVGQGICVFTFDEFGSFATVASIVALKLWCDFRFGVCNG